MVKPYLLIASKTSSKLNSNEGSVNKFSKWYSNGPLYKQNNEYNNENNDKIKMDYFNNI